MSKTAVFVTVDGEVLDDIQSATPYPEDVSCILRDLGYTKETCEEDAVFEFAYDHFEIGDGEAGMEILAYTPSEELELVEKFRKEETDLETFQGEELSYIDGDTFHVFYKDLEEELY